MKKCLLAIFLIVNMSSCRPLEGDRTYNLPNKYKTNLNDNDLLIYANQFNDLDTLIVLNIQNGYQEKSTTGTWGKPPFDIFEFQNIYIKGIHDTIDSWTDSIINQDDIYYDDFNVLPVLFDNCICIVNGLDDLYPSDGIEYDSKLSWYKIWRTKISNNVKIYDNLKIRNKTFYEIYEFSSDTSKIKSMYFTFKDGFIRYELSNGEIWEIIK